MKKRLYKSLLLIFAILLIDQSTKIWVKLSMLPGEEIKVIDDVLKIHFVENPGAAFGFTLMSIFPNLSPESAQRILVLFSMVIFFVVLYFWWKHLHGDSPMLWILSLIVAGAIGNLIDRIFYGILFAPINHYTGGWLLGQVVDMIYIDIWQGFLPSWIPLWGGSYVALWPIFNVADMSITIAILLLIFFPKRFMQEQHAHYQPAATQEKT